MRTGQHIFCLLFLLLLPLASHAQSSKQALDHDAYDIWQRINEEAISPDGSWVHYSMSPEYGDALLNVKNTASSMVYSIPRGVKAAFTRDSKHVVAHIKSAVDSVRQAKLDKVKKDDMPKDSLAIIDLASGTITHIPRVKSYKLPKEAGGWLTYHLEKPLEDEEDDAAEEPEGEESEENESEEEQEPKEKEDDKKKKDKAEGTPLVLRNLDSGEEWTFESVLEYTFSEDGEWLAYTASNKEGNADGVFTVRTGTGERMTVLSGEGVYKQPVFDKAGTQLAFLSNTSDYEADQPTYSLYHWTPNADSPTILADVTTSALPQGWWISEHGDVSFSEKGNRLQFGTAPRPPHEDKEETIPDDEKVKLDIWNWKDSLLQPMQLVQLKNEQNRSYLAVVHLSDGRVVQLANEAIPEVTIGTKGEADVAVGNSNMPYRQWISWKAARVYDVYVIDVNDGERRLAQEAVESRASLSPDSKYLTWWDRNAEGWYAQSTSGGDAVNLTASIPFPVYDEIHDRPFKANPYGSAGWTKNDAAFIVYDRHDLWSLDPTGNSEPINLTEGVGREENMRFRYASLDPEQTAIDPEEPMLLHGLNYTTKGQGFYRDRIQRSRSPELLIQEAAAFSRPSKAKNADMLLLTRETFQEFPNLMTSNLDFQSLKKQSDANPQQADYLWGSAELFHWTSLDGIALDGILYKPDNFDPAKKYPMMVYFYEKMSNSLHQHRPPATARSSISFSFYTSRGYLVFVPDIPYKIGYPGESALNAVVPGVTELIKEGFVDEKNIGVQGHSWGGYQIAYMVTESNIFKAAEAGAPVSNMTSAYGGIRWASGMSRMFQYEETQSRIGGTLWEYPLRYIDNSPLFQADKIETPLLMMHNDADGAVPWYQGIELFVALRRLGKPAWMLNYNDEAHGLREYHNRRDWAIRMQQFFDHYLKGAPAPIWMSEGVPAIQKGKTLGLELDIPKTEAVSADDQER